MSWLKEKKYGAGTWADPAGVVDMLMEEPTQQINLEAMMTPEQKEAMSLLSTFGKTGKLGDFQAGQQYDLSQFSFDPTMTEQAGIEMLQRNLSAPTGVGLSDAQKALMGIVNTEFTPDDPSSGFGAFQRQLARAMKGSEDVLNREAAMTGGRFGTGIQRQKTDLAAQQSDIAASKLADLWQQTQGNRLAAAQGLAGIAGTKEQITQSRIQQAFELGSKQRDLQNSRAQANYDEWLRARNERIGSIGALTDVMNKGVDWGMKSYEQKDPSLFSQILGAFGGYVGSKVGGGGRSGGGGGDTTTSSGVSGGGTTSRYSSVPSSDYMARRTVGYSY